uniref:GYDIA family GHMP kinase n=1 Tax=Flavobacterium sp. TaxID=239 RepID=UPI004049B880
MKKVFYSNGKLLLTGEYVVLDGAKALAVPTKFGQSLTIYPGKENQLKWTSFDVDNSIWFEDVILFEEITSFTKESEIKTVKGKLTAILHQAFLQNPSFITDFEGYVVETNLTFPRLWGLGTSSTLINNIGQWLHIDAFELLKESFGGSGYDVACAQTDKPIIYQLEDSKSFFDIVHFNPSFKENIHFVYLNQKQNSSSAIANYFSKNHNLDKNIAKITAITNAALLCTEGRDFALLMEKHQAIMSTILQTETVKEKHFPDFKGVIKSLGAWGGDFVMVLSKQNPKEYFKAKGFETILTYDEMVL